MSTQSRRGLLKNAAAAAAAVTGAALLPTEAIAQKGGKGVSWEKKAIKHVDIPNAASTAKPGVAPVAGVPLFNSIITYGGLVFIAGTGAHFTGTIEEHTKHVLDEIELQLIAAGSSMEKVLKVNVYLTDLANFQRMNAVYTGRFGAVPPVRTTIAVGAGVPGDSLVEIDCIAAL
jgi:2-iminobutanoate/2-iminopropanoate deaminase